MKKVVISNVTMQPKVTKCHYAVEGNSKIEYDGKVYFPINGVMAKTMNEDDEIKVILIKTLDNQGMSNVNEKLFKEELEDINKDIGAKINYVAVDISYNLSNSDFRKLLCRLAEELTGYSDLYVDVTYGPKPLMVLLFNLMTYAERGLDMNIRQLIYGKAEFRRQENGDIVPYDTKIVDITGLYYLNNILCSINIDKSRAYNVLDDIINV